MRQVPAYLRELSGHDPISHVDPDEAVALGAAIQVHLPAPEYLVTKVPDAKDEAFTGRIRMKKNTWAQLALYPSPVIVVGAMVDGGLSV